MAMMALHEDFKCNKWLLFSSLLWQWGRLPVNCWVVICHYGVFCLNWGREDVAHMKDADEIWNHLPKCIGSQCYCQDIDPFCHWWLQFWNEKGALRPSNSIVLTLSYCIIGGRINGNMIEHRAQHIFNPEKKQELSEIIQESKKGECKLCSRQRLAFLIMWTLKWLFHSISGERLNIFALCLEIGCNETLRKCIICATNIEWLPTYNHLLM